MLLGAGLMLSGKEEGAIVGWSMLWIPESTKEASAAGRCLSPRHRHLDKVCM